MRLPNIEQRLSRTKKLIERLKKKQANKTRSNKEGGKIALFV